MVTFLDKHTNNQNSIHINLAYSINTNKTERKNKQKTK